MLKDIKSGIYDYYIKVWQITKINAFFVFAFTNVQFFIQNYTYGHGNMLLIIFYP